MNLNNSTLFRPAGLLAATLLATASVFATEAAKTESDAIALAEGENYIKLSGTYTDFDGDKGASQTRTQIAEGLSGGIEDFRFNHELSKIDTLLINGTALPGAEEYLLQFRLTRNEVGTFETGYKSTRTFYDGAGGFFPTNQAWLPIYPRALYVDRGKFYVNVEIAQPKAPVYSFKYANETRDGRKNSTIWGDTDATGIPIYSNSALNPVSANRKIIPAYLDLDERHETWEAAFRHVLGSSKVFFSVSGDNIDNLNTRSVDRYPGELRPFPAIPSTPVTIVPVALANNEVRGFDTQGVDQKSIAYMGKVVTPLASSTDFFIEANYRSGDGDTTGSRLMTGKIQTLAGVKSEVGAFTPGGRPPYSYNSTGQVEFDVFTAVAGVESKVTKDLRLTGALKYEDFSSTANTAAGYVSTMINQTTGVVTPVPLDATNASSVDEEMWVPEVEFRYTGIKSISIYGSGDYRDSPGDEMTRYQSVTTSTGGPVVLPAPTITTQKVQDTHYNVTLGMNWDLTRQLALRGEVFSKTHEDAFTGYGTSVGNFYVLNYDILGTRLTCDWKLTPTLSFKTRYVYQEGKSTVATETYAEGDASDSVRHHIGETIDWNPNKLFYFQLNLNVVFDTTSTAYPKAGGLANDVLRNADNNYWNGSAVAGWVLGKFTDAQLMATYYEADNYQPELAAGTMPYGAGGKDWGLFAGLKHKFSDRCIGHAKAGYLDSRNDTAGGYSDFKGPLAYLSLEWRL